MLYKNKCECSYLFLNLLHDAQRGGIDVLQNKNKTGTDWLA